MRGKKLCKKNKKQTQQKTKKAVSFTDNNNNNNCNMLGSNRALKQYFTVIFQQNHKSCVTHSHRYFSRADFKNAN